MIVGMTNSMQLPVQGVPEGVEVDLDDFFLALTYHRVPGVDPVDLLDASSSCR